MSATWAVGVVIPARDEETTIVGCVASVRHALAVADVDGTVVVVADRCADATVRLARRALGRAGTVVTTDVGRVGAARRVGTEALRAGPASHRRTWVATTDADGRVPPHWIATQLRIADAGAAAVAGVVRLDDATDPVAPLHEHTYVVRPDGTHPHVHGANLGVRRDALDAVGGWGDLATAEDHDLWGRLVDGGWSAVASVESWVWTSARRAGRAPDGFAGHLRALEAAG